jgi:hypothetical protein
MNMYSYGKSTKIVLGGVLGSESNAIIKNA